MFDLQKYKEEKARELAALKTHLDNQLATVTDHLKRQRIAHAKAMYADLCKQVEETNRSAFEMYERRINRTYPSETLKKAIHESAEVQLISMLRTGEVILADFRNRFIS